MDVQEAPSALGRAQEASAASIPNSSVAMHVQEAPSPSGRAQDGSAVSSPEAGAEDLTRLAEEDEADEATKIGRTAEEVATIRQEMDTLQQELATRELQEHEEPTPNTSIGADEADGSPTIGRAAEEVATVRRDMENLQAELVARHGEGPAVSCASLGAAALSPGGSVPVQAMCLSTAREILSRAAAGVDCQVGGPVSHSRTPLQTSRNIDENRHQGTSMGAVSAESSIGSSTLGSRSSLMGHKPKQHTTDRHLADLRRATKVLVRSS